MDLLGSHQYRGNTDFNGYFTLSGIRKGNYSLKASKADDINGISSYDASLILQYSVGLITLNPNQMLAADVDGNGKINPLDATYVLEKSVDRLNLPFPGAGKIWTFVEEEKNYQNLEYDLNYQDFTSVLIGDVDGN